MRNTRAITVLLCVLSITALAITGCKRTSESDVQKQIRAPQLNISQSFHASGVREPIVRYMEPSSKVPGEVSKVAAEVHFDLLSTKMRFSMPCYPCLVTENNIHYSNGWTETYDPRASSSCEILWDNDAETSRMWIESETPARIIVRWRAAIADPDGYIGHSNIPSGSPYGEGDWTDEWYYIYPDGTHTRHVRIYTGLAGQSLTVTDEQFQGIAPIREIPPAVVHEFQEEFIFGQDGHVPEDDIDIDALTLIKMDGSSKTISYDPYPEDYGSFTMANIMVVNTRSQYKPFTVFIPHGIENQPYPLEGEAPHTFQTWPSNPDDKGYSVSLGHTLNWWHFRRTENILEQVYLSGMIQSDEPEKELLPLAKSWLHYPRLIIEGYELSYTNPAYDQAQKAYILPGTVSGPQEISFKLGFPEKFEEEVNIPVHIVNPVFIVRNWGETGVKLKLNGKELVRGSEFRVGYEEKQEGTDLVIWLDYRANEQISIDISPEN